MMLSDVEELMESLDSYFAKCQQMGREAFVRLYPHPFLLVRPTEQEGERWRGYSTEAITPAEVQDASSDSLAYRVIRVVKSSKSPFPARISIGRARNNDLLIPDPSVSKLHAYLELLHNGTATLTETGSLNGTQVNGRTIAKGEAVEILPGATLLIGQVDAIYQDPGGFFDFCNAAHGHE